MELELHQVIESLFFRGFIIPHSSAVMVLALDFYPKYPDRVGDAVKIFLFLEISPLEGLESSLFVRS